MTDGPWLTDRQQRVWRHWLTVTAQLPVALNRQLQQDASLSLSDFEVLVHLSETPEHRLRVTDLARALTWEKSRLSHHLTRMERRGLAQRQECPEDGRGSFVSLTALGREAIEGAAPGHVRAVRSLLFDRLDDDDLDALDRVLTTMLADAEDPSP